MKIHTLSYIERHYIKVALKVFNYDRTLTARALGISKATLYNKVCEHKRRGFRIPFFTKKELPIPDGPTALDPVEIAYLDFLLLQDPTELDIVKTQIIGVAK